MNTTRRAWMRAGACLLALSLGACAAPDDQTAQESPPDTPPDVWIATTSLTLPEVGDAVPTSYTYPQGCDVLTEDVDGESAFKPTLAMSGCMKIVDGAQPTWSEGALPYTVRVPFWSDGATKDRAIFLPQGTTIGFEAMEAWDLPEGAHIGKSFALDGRVFETRFMVRVGDEWIGATYRWRDDGSDADLVTERTDMKVAGQTWALPSPQDCTTCHTRAAGYVLGVRTEQMFAEGDLFGRGSVNQIAGFEAAGLFETTPDLSAVAIPLPRLDGQESTTERARSYLAANCANCHRPQGAAHASIDLRYGTDFIDTYLCDFPLSGGAGLGGSAYIVEPGAPEQSVLIQRMQNLDDTAMPSMLRYEIDTQGVALLSEWITQMEADVCAW